MAKLGLFVNLLLVYSLMNVLAYFISNVMIFLPPPPGYTDAEANIIKLKTSDNKVISAMYLFNENAEYTIIYSHGNAIDIGYLKKFIQSYHANNFSILSYDYHGYGTSEGYPTEKNTYMDIQAAYNFLVNKKHVDPKKIILIGNSVGGGPTLELATNEEIAGVVLESSFVTAFRVLTRLPLFVVDKYRNNKKIKKLKVPVLFIHGDRDITISTWHSRSLYKDANEPKKLVIVKGADHNNLFSVMGENYWKELKEFSKNLKHP